MVTVTEEAEEGVGVSVKGTETDGTGEMELAVEEMHEVPNGSPVKTEAGEEVADHATVLPRI